MSPVARGKRGSRVGCFDGTRRASGRTCTDAATEMQRHSSFGKTRGLRLQGAIECTLRVKTLPLVLDGRPTAGTPAWSVSCRPEKSCWSLKILHETVAGQFCQIVHTEFDIGESHARACFRQRRAVRGLLAVAASGAPRSLGTEPQYRIERESVFAVASKSVQCRCWR